MADKIGRNDPCPCGSGKKYKKCCLSSRREEPPRHLSPRLQFEPGSYYLEQVKKEVAYIKPHENDDLEWRNEGMTLLRKGKLKAAELKFKELIMSQPEHHDGYHGLALVYQKLGRKDEAVVFMQEAIVRAKRFLDDGTLDQEALDWLEEDLERIQQT